MSGILTDATCEGCNKPFKPGEEVVVKTVTRGVTQDSENVEFDPYDEVQEVYHNDCYNKAFPLAHLIKGRC